MNHNIVALRSAESAHRATVNQRIEAHAPVRKPLRQRLVEALGFAGAVVLASSCTIGGMTLLGFWHA